MTAGRSAARLRDEVNLVNVNQGAHLRVVLAYPNTYHVGMSNLGVHTVYRLFNEHPEVFCERVFLPDPEERHGNTGCLLTGLESGRPVADADMLAFSASFENDYIHVLDMLTQAGLPLRSETRDERHPLIVMGGATVSINPEPVAAFLDVCCLGEGEKLADLLVDALLECGSRDELLEQLAASSGFYVPRYYRPVYESSGPDRGRFSQIEVQKPAPDTLTKVRTRFDRIEHVAATAILTPHTEFGDRLLVEVARGCTKGCRYCWVGYNILPFRVHAREHILEIARRWKPYTRRVGLVATALLDHPETEAIAADLRDNGFGVFSPSLIISTLREPLLKAIVESGQETITVAPETGSDRMRELIMKRITNEEILDKARMIFRAGAVNLKNYVIIGLPGETEDDLQDLVNLAAGMQRIMLQECRGRGRLGTISLSINCLIPKPGTPFQWAVQISPAAYRVKLRWLQRRISKLPNVEIDAMPTRSAEIQGVLSRGDRRVADLLELWQKAGKWSTALQAWREVGGPKRRDLIHNFGVGDPLPWGHLRIGPSVPALTRQWNLAQDLVS